MNAPKTDTKSTFLAIVTGFVLLYFIFHLKWMLTVAAVAGFIGLFIPPLAALVEKGWLKLAMAMGWLNGRILLGLVFFAILTPIALLRKLFGGSKALALQRSTGSHWSVRDHTYTASDLEKPW